MRIIFETHSITLDNEANLASGWNDVELSEAGREKAKEFGKRYTGTKVDAIFCSDLKRAYNTAQIAFPDIAPNRIFLDWRLRECDYGDMTRADKDEVEKEKVMRIIQPFPNGESYEQAMERMKSFIDDLRKMSFENVVIIGSRATHHGLDHWLCNISIEDCLTTKFTWQPGWEYKLGDKS